MDGAAQLDPTGLRPPARDRMPKLVAAVTFAGVLLIGLGLYLVEFQLPPLMTKVLPWTVIGAFVLTIKLSKPVSKLTPAERRRREDRYAGALVGGMGGLVILGGIAAAACLDSWSKWVVLCAILIQTFGVGIMVKIRFTHGKY
ncbi:MAG: hypothetical protein PGN13_00955 [Patulibacter minatonensis]